MNTIVNFIFAALLAGTPLLFGTLGELISEKAGCLNLGVEGMMWIGSFAGFFAALKTGSAILSLAAAFGAAALGAAIYAFLTVTLRANQNVTGLTLTTFGVGLSLVLGSAMCQAHGAAPSLSASFRGKLAPLAIPFLSELPIAGKLVFSLYPMTYFAVALCVIAAVFYKKTRTGLSVRAVGENPAAADAAGVSVSAAKYASVIVGGGICGIGGAFMSLIIGNGTWMPAGIVNGFGWIAVALVIFVRWKPMLAVLGAFVFGIFQSMRYYIPDSVLSLPNAFYQMLPFVLTLVVLVASSIRKSVGSGEPSAIGLNYFREER